MHNHPRNQNIKTEIAIVVTSDTRHKGIDTTGQAAITILKEAGHNIPIYEIIPNDREKIIQMINSVLQEKSIKVIITSGGTGISPRDKTIGVINSLLDFEIPGFGELFRSLSYEDIGVHGVISRASAGIIDGRLVFCLPGSEAAVKLALKEIVIPLIGHMLWELNRK
jgi:molybdenum cofactor biosynthesis protein B